MMFLDPTELRLTSTMFQLMCGASFWVRCAPGSYDVHPKVSGMGRFYGRIWIEDEDGNVVRFNGTYTGASRRGLQRSTTSTSTVGG